MKKRWISLLLVIMLFTIGTAVYAHETDQEISLFNFDEMLPFMEQMHPNWSDKQLEDMYNDCHGNGNSNREEYMDW
ncbi:hypothetical protein [Chengkuizengella marina]|uniref:Uncharacterized protein n=1 Tax=Chengkuizengella marina TaxID=2507566 RepID=A0A6N9Q895_9BACL|nr:hypothetical protein [Chengkuizengella marina]NBI30883.1 hypothetical protein [Chengkuizengella marina]